MTRISALSRVLSDLFLVLAATLVAHGLYGLSLSAWYAGAYFDDRLILFDNGVYPFLWGSLFLLIGQLSRLHLRRAFMGGAALAALLLFAWKRITLPSVSRAGQSLFPDAELLDGLITVGAVMLALALADRHVQRAIDGLLIRPGRALWRSRRGPS